MLFAREGRVLVAGRLGFVLDAFVVRLLSRSTINSGRWTVHTPLLLNDCKRTNVQQYLDRSCFILGIVSAFLLGSHTTSMLLLCCFYAAAAAAAAAHSSSSSSPADASQCRVT